VGLRERCKLSWGLGRAWPPGTISIAGFNVELDTLYVISETTLQVMWSNQQHFGPKNASGDSSVKLTLVWYILQFTETYMQQ